MKGPADLIFYVLAALTVGSAILVAVPGGDAAAELERTGATVVEDLEAILGFLPPVNAGP